MSLHLTTRQRCSDVVVLRVTGVGEERLLVELIDAIEALADRVPCVVIDVDDLVLFSAGAVRRFVEELFDRVEHGRLRFAARRSSARLILRRWGGSDVAIVASAEHVGCDGPTASIR